MLGISVSRQHEITGQFTSLTKQRREVLGHREDLESLGRRQGKPHVELIASPKNRSNRQKSSLYQIVMKNAMEPPCRVQVGCTSWKCRALGHQELASTY